MKQQAIHFVGLDVHQSTVVASVRDESGKVVMKATVPTEEEAIVALVRNSSWPRVHVAFEEGTQAQWLHDVLIDQVERVVVCNVRGKGPLANKNDRIDADELSEKLRTGGLKPVFHGAPEILTLKELVRNYNNLVEDSTRVMLRIKAIFRARAIPTPGVSVYRTSQRKQWLGEARGRSSHSSGVAADATGWVARAAAESEGGDDRRGASAAGLEGAALDPVSRPRSCGAAAGHHADAVPLPDETESVAVRRAGGG